MKDQITLVVLAAGIGSRFGGLKQVQPLGPSGEAIIDYSVFDAIRAGFSRVVFVIRKDIEADFRRIIGRVWEKRVDAAYAFQELDHSLPSWFKRPSERVKPWGTAHAILCCRDVVKEPFAAINADDFYGLSSYRSIHEFLTTEESGDISPSTYGFVGYKLRNTLSEHGTVSRGVCKIGENGELLEVDEMLKIEKVGDAARAHNPDGRTIPLTGDEVASMNIWGFKPSIFRNLGEGFPEFLRNRGLEPKSEYLIPVAVFEFIRAGKVRVKHIPTSEHWFGVTYPEDLAGVRESIRRMVASGLYPDDIRS